VTLIDLGNEPGTMVNGARVNKCKLHVGDLIQVGETAIVLESAEPAYAEAQAAPVPPSMPAAAPQPAPSAGPPMPPRVATMVGGVGMAPNPFAVAPSAPFAAASNPFEAPASNPFTAGGMGQTHPAMMGADPSHVPDDAPPGSYTYTMIKSGPDVSTDEVELPHVQAVEVMVLWGTNVLHVSHLTPPRNFYVGEEQSKNAGCDFFIPSERIGTTRLPVVVGDRMSVSLVIPPSATGYVEIPGQPRMSLEEVRPRAQPTAEVTGGHQLALPGGARARVELGGFVFQVAAVNAGKPIKKGVGASFDWAVASYFGLSFLVHAGFVAAMAFFVPPLGLTDDEDLDKD